MLQDFHARQLGTGVIVLSVGSSSGNQSSKIEDPLPFKGTNSLAGSMLVGGRVPFTYHLGGGGG